MEMNLNLEKRTWLRVWLPKDSVISNLDCATKRILADETVGENRDELRIAQVNRFSIGTTKNASYSSQGDQKISYIYVR